MPSVIDFVIKPKEETDRKGRLTYFGYVVEDPKTGRIILQNGTHVHPHQMDEEEQERLKRHLLRETLKAVPKPAGKVVLSGISVKYLL